MTTCNPQSEKFAGAITLRHLPPCGSSLSFKVILNLYKSAGLELFEGEESVQEDAAAAMLLSFICR